MMDVAPNLTTVLGESVGAKMLTHSGGLSNLAKMPSSTIQILGAEKALFRAIRKKEKTPKYGFLFNSSYIQKAKAIDKGKVSRMLANKCALASRMDFFL
jgi:nucleolar protein 56